MNYQILRNIIDAELQRFQNITEEEWSYRSSSEKWSKKKLLAIFVTVLLQISVDLL